LGSQNVVDAAIDQCVKKVLLVSTDKAAQPVNLYGSTKLCAEKLFINGNVYTEGKTIFSCVRYGNVLGSRGSIVETLLNKTDLEKVQITDEKMTRFWITLDQAYELVMFAIENMVGGEIFIPKISSMKIIDLFKALAPNAKKEFIGIRPGEKLHEVLVTKEEARHAIELEKYFVIFPEYKSIFDIEKKFEKLLSIGKKVPLDFSYTSDTNKKWLTEEDLTSLLKK